jgi:hypothetical protein
MLEVAEPVVCVVCRQMGITREMAKGKREKKSQKAHRPAPCSRRKHGGVAATKTWEGFCFLRGGRTHNLFRFRTESGTQGLVSGPDLGPGQAYKSKGNPKEGPDGLTV